MVRRMVRRAAELAGYSFFRTEQLPFGLDMPYDVQRLCRQLGQEVKVVIDVGAHIGKTTQRYRNAFPSSKIIAFEPTPDTFEQLSVNIHELRDVKAEQMALGSVPGEAELIVYELSVLNSLWESTANSYRYKTKGRKVTCKVDTLDAYCERNGIERIDLLKIDTEGSEIAVLQGASRMLSSDAARFVYAEFNEILTDPWSCR